MDNQIRERLRLALSVIVDYLMSQDMPPFQDMKDSDISELSDAETRHRQEPVESVETNNPPQ